MLLIPAIDIKNNNCVRLKKGDINKFKIFSKNPLISLNKWINLGLERFHIVDLDGAIKGKPKNLLILKKFIKFFNKKIKIQVGGGIRSLEIINHYFDIGISYIILGTKAILDLEFLRNVCEKYKNKIILALDLKNFNIAIDGWKNYYNLNIFDFIKKINYYELDSIIYTDVKRDGMLKGLNFKNFLKILNSTEKPLIISGGLSFLNDIRKIFSFKKNNLLGIICGTSIYLGNLNLKNINDKISYFNKIFI